MKCLFDQLCDGEGADNCGLHSALFPQVIACAQTLRSKLLPFHFFALFFFFLSRCGNGHEASDKSATTPLDNELRWLFVWPGVITPSGSCRRVKPSRRPRETHLERRRTIGHKTEDTDRMKPEVNTGTLMNEHV